MKKNIFAAILFAMSAFLFTGCGDKGKVEVGEGTGTINYGETTYHLKRSTVITSGPANDGTYTHLISVMSRDAQNFFIFSTESGSQSIPAGQFEVRLTGAHTATFNLNEVSRKLSGNAVGTMTISSAGDGKYTFSFTGTDFPGEGEGDPKALTMNYTGETDHK